MKKSNALWGSPLVIVALILLAAILIGLSVFGKKTVLYQTSKTEEVHFHAGFRIYKDNTLIDFSAPQFMHLKPCGDEDEHTEENQLEWAHLHDQIGDVVHVHKDQVKWQTLLQNLRFDVGQTAIFYLNGEKINDLPNRVIGPYDRALFLVGKNTDHEQKIESVPDRDTVEKAEQKTEGC